MACSLIPNLLLGQDSIVTYHDQLDGELIAYILQAKNLFAGGVLPEFMGGMSKTALTVPAPVFVLLFLGGNYFGALMTMLLIGRIVGFVGMYLLARDVTKQPWIAGMVAVVYGLLPFLPVYGLSQFGIPMLFWCVINLKKNQRKLFSYLYVAVYGLGSSLVLVGFGLLGMGLVLLLAELWKGSCRGSEKKDFLRLGGAYLSLLGIYVAENYRLLAQMLGIGTDDMSHKAEYALSATPFLGSFWESLASGSQHCDGYQKLFVPVILLAVGLSLLFLWRNRDAVKSEHRKGELGRLFKGLGFCLVWNVFFALITAVWNAELIVELRRNMGALRAFQVDRLLWIAPCLWYLLAACGMAIVVEAFESVKSRLVRLGAMLCLCMTMAAVGITAIWVLLAGDIKSNIQKLRNPDYGLLSFREYYAVGVLEQVKDFLNEATGMEQGEYRVVSLGIDPAAAMYHGFYCLDGYSNNYSLEYKEAFREVIAPELEKSEYLQAYYDDWGNRCYLFSAECPGYYTIEKNGFYFQDYRLGTDALKALGGNYLFSAAYIQNAEQQGLKLLNETPFETEESYYRIFVYEICD